MPRFIRYTLFAALLGIFGAPFGVGHAATQSLALLETDAPLPLVCENGVCKAEFSTFCLQKERDLPRAGDPYTVADGGAVGLVLTGPDGSVKRVPAASHVRISAARSGHTAVTIELNRSVLDRLGAHHAAIEVGERVALMPVPIVGDDNPQTEQDKLLAAGPLRQLGQAIVDQGPHDINRVRVLNRLINALPDSIDMHADARQTLWRRAVDTGFQAAPPARVAKAAQEYDACWQDRVVALFGYSVRHCLQRQHDGLMWGHVKRYWNAAGAGS
ncbi:MAG: hypothetical protein GKS00_05680 [Alphaproteobacteria bacterium]|nr:hypothetical protein [Alphaproteobacteria bacterium]